MHSCLGALAPGSGLATSGNRVGWATLARHPFFNGYFGKFRLQIFQITLRPAGFSKNLKNIQGGRRKTRVICDIGGGASKFSLK